MTDYFAEAERYLTIAQQEVTGIVAEAYVRIAHQFIDAGLQRDKTEQPRPAPDTSWVRLEGFELPWPVPEELQEGIAKALAEANGNNAGWGLWTRDVKAILATIREWVRSNASSNDK